MRRSLLPALFALLLAVPAAAQAGDTVAARPGDAVRLAVWRQPEFTGEFAIGSDGTILHPLLSGVRVVGVTRTEVREQLRRTLQQYENDPQFVVEFLYRVGVSGEVRLPNLYTLTPETTLVQAVAAAGGAGAEARLDRARLLRDGREMEIDLLEPTAEVAAMKIRSGDQIRVPRQTQRFREAVSLFASVVAAVASVVGVVIIATQE